MSAADEHSIFEQHALDLDSVKVFYYERRVHEAESQGSAIQHAEENSTNKEEDWNWTKFGSASCSNMFVVFQKPLHALSLRYLLFP